MKILKWFVVNVFIDSMLIWGIVYGNLGAKNVGLFFLWTYSILAIISILPKDKKHLEAVRKRGRSVPAGLSIFVDMCTVAFLAYYGYFFLAVLWLFQIGAEAKIFDNDKNKWNDSLIESEICSSNDFKMQTNSNEEDCNPR